jgi:hypothetical protein
MAPDWWILAYELAEESHDPDRYDGRDWSDLTDQERDDAVGEALIGTTERG